MLYQGTPEQPVVRDIATAPRTAAGRDSRPCEGREVTLLNAFVGEELAATDAGECTKIVTWYRHGDALASDRHHGRRIPQQVGLSATVRSVPISASSTPTRSSG